MSQPKPDELQILNEDTEGLHFLADQGNTNNPGKIEMLLQNVNVLSTISRGQIKNH